MAWLAERLHDGDDLKDSLHEMVASGGISAAVILSGVGGLKRAVLRMADAEPGKQNIRTYDENLEIVSLTGVLGAERTHLHIALSDKEGKVIGGHLMQGSLVFLSAEIVLGSDETMRFDQALDPATGFSELKIIQEDS